MPVALAVVLLVAPVALVAALTLGCITWAFGTVAWVNDYLKR